MMAGGDVCGEGAAFFHYFPFAEVLAVFFALFRHAARSENCTSRSAKFFFSRFSFFSFVFLLFLFLLMPHASGMT